jgi:hypothetical protein
VQGDLGAIVYNVILTTSSHLYVGNLNYALSLHAKCDRPWAISYPPVVTRSYSSGSALDTFDYINGSAYNGYNRPNLTFTMGGSGGDLSVINASDGNREFLFEGLSAGEVMTVDNDKGIISSSGSSLRMANFNKNFLRLVQGKNTLTVSGSIVELTIDTVFAKGVGA